MAKTFYREVKFEWNKQNIKRYVNASQSIDAVPADCKKKISFLYCERFKYNRLFRMDGWIDWICREEKADYLRPFAVYRNYTNNYHV